jgi:hypothetical protein
VYNGSDRHLVGKVWLASSEIKFLLRVGVVVDSLNLNLPDIGQMSLNNLPIIRLNIRFGDWQDLTVLNTRWQKSGKSVLNMVCILHSDLPI